MLERTIKIGSNGLIAFDINVYDDKTVELPCFGCESPLILDVEESKSFEESMLSWDEDGSDKDDEKLLRYMMCDCCAKDVRLAARRRMMREAARKAIRQLFGINGPAADDE